MKQFIFLSYLFFHFNVGFSQVLFGGIEGLKDTSNYPGLRRDIDLQNFSIKMDSTYVPAYFKRAASEYQLGNYETCIGLQNEILQRFPDYAADAYTNRGMSYCFLKKYKLALNDLNTAKRLTPDNAMSYLNLAFAKSAIQEYKSAILDLDTAIMLRPSYAKAFANRAFAKAHLEKYAEGIEDYNKALEIQPDYPEVYFNRGYAKLKLNRYDEAIADFNKAIEIYPLFSSSYEFYLNRSLAYEKKGDQVHSRLDHEMAEKLKRD
ncbi:MAG: tetratricopeptide repeat protein [Ferruginibacter sp.]